jgi:hypothetical protein
MKFKFQYQYTKFYWNTATLICLCTAYGCIHATMAELNNCDRNHMTPKFKTTLFGPFQEKFADP